MQVLTNLKKKQGLSTNISGEARLSFYVQYSKIYLHFEYKIIVKKGC